MPLKQLAPEFGVEPNQLSAVCKAFQIPTPPPGYWTLMEMGKPVERAPLPPAPDGVGETVTIEAKAKRMRRAVSPPPPPQTQENADVLPAIHAPPDVTPAGHADPTGEIHKLALRTQSKLATSRGSDLVRVHGRGLFNVTAAPALADRIGRILSDLIVAVEAQEWRVENTEVGFRLVPDGEPITFEIVEQTDRLKHVPTDAEQAALRKHEEARQRAARRGQWFSDWDRPKLPEWDRVPNGLLTLNLTSDAYLPDPIRRKFSDGKHQQVERMIDKVIESLAAYAASTKALRERRERERLEALEAEKRREDARRRQELENKRVEFLQAQMKRLARAREIEDFVREIEAQGGADGPLAAFLDWARDWSEELRAELSSETLRKKLERFDLMNEAARIGSWVKVE